MSSKYAKEPLTNHSKINFKLNAAQVPKKMKKGLTHHKFGRIICDGFVMGSAILWWDSRSLHEISCKYCSFYTCFAISDFLVTCFAISVFLAHGLPGGVAPISVLAKVPCRKNDYLRALTKSDNFKWKNASYDCLLRTARKLSNWLHQTNTIWIPNAFELSNYEEGIQLTTPQNELHIRKYEYTFLCMYMYAYRDIYL